MRQPWASAIAEGRKEYETRSWNTSYRGALAIHAGKNRYHIGCSTDYPLGAVLAVGELVAVFRVESLRVSSTESELGDWTPGRYAWQICNVRRLPEPILWRGAQSLWNVPPSLEEQLRAAVDKCF